MAVENILPSGAQMASLLNTQKQIRDAVLVLAHGEETSQEWAHIRDNVLEGHGPLLYPVGTQFVTPHTTYGNIVWEVTGHDQIASATGKAHTMTLLAKCALTGNSVQFDSAEAAIACDTALTAGTTYHFAHPDGSGTFQFTASVNCPVGTQLVPTLSDYAITALTPYAQGSTTTLGAAMPVTAGAGGTEIPATSVNHHHRFRYGSNNYKESAIRQFLNSDGAAGTYWTPQTKYDRPPSWNGSLIGFKAGFANDFLNAIDTPVVKCSTNNTFESQDSTTPRNSQYTVADQFFLPSRYEIYGSSDVADGSVMMSYFVGASDTRRVRTYNNSAVYWWLRTPNSGTARNVKLVNVDGSWTSDTAVNGYALVPACII